MGNVILAPSDFQILLEKTARFSACISAKAREADDVCAIDPSIWNHFHATGLGTATFPREFGGLALSDGPDLCKIIRQLGAADLSMARLIEGHLNAVALVCRYGTVAQIGDMAKSAAAGALAAVWAADDACGLHVVSDGAEKRLQGRKVLASGAGFVTRPLIAARAKDGQLLLLLNLAPGYKFDLSEWQALGMKSTATGSVDFTGHHISKAEIVGKPGDYMRQPHFSGGAWRFCAAHLGATERLVELFRAHLTQSGRGNDPYQLQRLAVCTTSAKTARFWVEEAAKRLGVEDSDPQEVAAFANLTRNVTERSALDVMQLVQRGVGLRAFVRPHDIERICRDLATYLRQPAPDHAMIDGARTILNSPLSIGDF